MKLGLSSVREAHNGVVTSIQRFGSAANLKIISSGYCLSSFIPSIFRAKRHHRESLLNLVDTVGVGFINGNAG